MRKLLNKFIKTITKSNFNDTSKELWQNIRVILEEYCQASEVLKEL